MFRVILLCLVATLMGCKNGTDTTIDLKSTPAWQQYREARKAKDLERTLAVIDSMEQVKVISPPKADHLRGFAYDDGWQMRIAEHFYKKSYEGYAPDPSQDWHGYADAGYRWACLRFGRGDTEGALSVITALLSQAEENESFPRNTVESLLILMAECQIQMHQNDEARRNWQKASAIRQQLNKASQRADLPYLSLAISTGLYDMGDAEGAQEWLKRAEEELTLYEQQGDSLITEEWKGHIALKRACYLQATGHTAEAAATYAAVPQSRIMEPRGYMEAAKYLMDAGRYDEAAYWYERMDDTYQATDGAQMTFDIIASRLSPRYAAYRKAGRNSDALVIADSINAAIDSALVWHKRNDAAEQAVIYQTYEKELALEESEAKTTVYRIFSLSLLIVMIVILATLWRLAKAHRRVLIKNRELYESFQREQKREVSDLQRMARQPEQERTPNEQLYLRLVELMKKQQPYTDAELNRDTLAAMLGTNHRYIDDAIRECSDSQSTKAFIDGYRVEHAARLLTSTKDSIALIAEMSGFANRTTFNEQFRSRYKMTPSEFREAAYQ